MQKEAFQSVVIFLNVIISKVVKRDIPRNVKRFFSNNECKFKDECAYHHKETTYQEDEDIKRL